MIPTAMLPITNAVLLFSWCSMMLGGTVVVLDCSDCEYFLCASINRAKPSGSAQQPSIQLCGRLCGFDSLLLVDGNLSSDETVLLGFPEQFGFVLVALYFH